MAADGFQKALELKANDGPTEELLRFMESFQFSNIDMIFTCSEFLLLNLLDKIQDFQNLTPAYKNN